MSSFFEWERAQNPLILHLQRQTNLSFIKERLCLQEGFALILPQTISLQDRDVTNLAESHTVLFDRSGRRFVSLSGIVGLLGGDATGGSGGDDDDDEHNGDIDAQASLDSLYVLEDMSSSSTFNPLLDVDQSFFEKNSAIFDAFEQRSSSSPADGAKEPAVMILRRGKMDVGWKDGYAAPVLLVSGPMVDAPREIEEKESPRLPRHVPKFNAALWSSSSSPATSAVAADDGSRPRTFQEFINLFGSRAGTDGGGESGPPPLFPSDINDDGGGGGGAPDGVPLSSSTLATAAAPMKDAMHYTKTFFDKMRRKEASDLTKRIKRFVASFNANPPPPSKQANLVGTFLDNTEKLIESHSLWKGASGAELEGASEGLEKYVTRKIYDRMFARDPATAKKDAQLERKLEALQFLGPENFDVSHQVAQHPSVVVAQSELRKMNAYRSPRSKMVCIMNCCKAIFSALSGGGGGEPNSEAPSSGGGGGALAGADEFLPVMIFVLLRACPRHTHSNVQFIRQLRSPRKLEGTESGYYLTNLELAMAFIENADAAQLNVSKETFDAHMAAQGRTAAAAPKVVDKHARGNDHVSFDLTSVSSADDGSEDTDHPALVRASSVSSLSRLSEDYSEDGDAAGSMMATSTTMMVEDSASIAIAYPFLHRKAQGLRLGEVSQLLEDYRRLAGEHRRMSARIQEMQKTFAEERSGGATAATIAPAPSAHHRNHQHRKGANSPRPSSTRRARTARPKQPPPPTSPSNGRSHVGDGHVDGAGKAPSPSTSHRRSKSLATVFSSMYKNPS